MAIDEPEIRDGQRAMPQTQILFEGSRVPPDVPNPNDVTWYGTNVSPLRGAFGFVREGDGLEDLVGEFLSVRSAVNRNNAVTVYMLGEYPDLEAPIAIARAAFLRIQLLPLTPASCYVERIR